MFIVLFIALVITLIVFVLFDYVPYFGISAIVILLLWVGFGIHNSIHKNEFKPTNEYRVITSTEGLVLSELIVQQRYIEVITFWDMSQADKWVYVSTVKDFKGEIK